LVLATGAFIILAPLVIIKARGYPASLMLPPVGYVELTTAGSLESSIHEAVNSDRRCPTVFIDEIQQGDTTRLLGLELFSRLLLHSSTLCRPSSTLTVSPLGVCYLVFNLSTVLDTTISTLRTIAVPSFGPRCWFIVIWYTRASCYATGQCESISTARGRG
jgi:hypothetical protein